MGKFRPQQIYEIGDKYFGRTVKITIQEDNGTKGEYIGKMTGYTLWLDCDDDEEQSLEIRYREWGVLVELPFDLVIDIQEVE